MAETISEREARQARNRARRATRRSASRSSSSSSDRFSSIRDERGVTGRIVVRDGEIIDSGTGRDFSREEARRVARRSSGGGGGSSPDNRIAVDADSNIVDSGSADEFSREQARVAADTGRARPRSTPFLTTRSGFVPVSEGFAGKFEQAVEQGDFERINRENRERQADSIQEFARATDTGGVSLARGGQAAVTSRGELVGAASTEEGPRLFSESGVDVTPTATPPPRLSAAPEPSSLSRFARRVGDSRLTPFSGEQASSATDSLGSGFSRGFSEPARSMDQVFGISAAGRREFSRFGSPQRVDRAFIGGQLLGSASNVAGLGAAGVGLRFVGGALRPGASRVASGLGLTTSASRQAAGAVAAPLAVSALTAPRFVSATRRGVESDSLGRELTLASVRTGAELGFVGAGASSRAGQAAARAGDSVSGFVPSFGRFSSSASTSPVSAASQQISSSLTPSTSSGVISSDALSIRPGALAVARQVRPSSSGFVRSSRFVGTPSTVGRIAGFTGRGAGTDVQTTLTFGPGAGAVQRGRGFPRVTPQAASLIAAGRQRSEPASLSVGQFRRLPQLQEGFDGLLPSQQRLGLPPVRARGLQTQLEFPGARPPPPGIDPTPSTPNFAGGRVPGFPTGRRGQASLSRFEFPQAFTPGRISSLRQPPSRLSSRPSTQLGRPTSAARSQFRGLSSGLFVGAAGVGRLTNQLSTQSVGSQQLLTPRLGSTALSRSGTGPSTGLRDLTRTSSLLRQGTDTSLDTRQTTSTSFDFPGFNFQTPTSPRRPPSRPPSRATPPPAVPGLQIPDFDISGISESRRRPSRSQEEFTPSLVANVFNIRSATPPRQAATGLSVRPITNNFNLGI